MTFSHPLTSYFEGAAVAFGIMGMFHAIHDRTWFCSFNPYGEDGHPAGPRECAGQNFWHPETPNEPCWMCGKADMP